MTIPDILEKIANNRDLTYDERRELESWFREVDEKLNTTQEITHNLGGDFVELRGHDPHAVVITDDNGMVTTDPDLEFIRDASYILGSQLSTGTINGTNSTGIQITGLTIGQWYAIEGTGGPWHMHTVLPVYSGDFYNFQLSLDGITFSGDIGYNNVQSAVQLTLPSFAAFAEAVNSSYGRVYFQATTTSVWFRCVDDTFGDNSGSLGYILSFASSGDKRITLYDEEYTYNKLASAIHAQTAKTTPSSGDEFTLWDSLTNLGKKITWVNILAALYVAITAADVTISDAGGYYTSSDVEGALQEIGGNLFAGIVMETGVTFPPVPLTNAEGTDWIYATP